MESMSDVVFTRVMRRIKRGRGRITVRELQRAFPKVFPRSQDASEFLMSLVGNGAGAITKRKKRSCEFVEIGRE